MLLLLIATIVFILAFVITTVPPHLLVGIWLEVQESCITALVSIPFRRCAICQYWDQSVFKQLWRHLSFFGYSVLISLCNLSPYNHICMPSVFNRRLSKAWSINLIRIFMLFSLSFRAVGSLAMSSSPMQLHPLAPPGYAWHLLENGRLSIAKLFCTKVHLSLSIAGSLVLCSWFSSPIFRLQVAHCMPGTDLLPRERPCNEIQSCWVLLCCSAIRFWIQIFINISCCNTSWCLT